MTPNPRYLDMTIYGGSPADKTWFAPRRPGPAHAKAHKAVEARARQTAFALVKRVARDYGQRPATLSAIAGGLQFLSPMGMIAVLRQNPPPKHRHFGFGGEVPTINYRAAMLCARLLRARQAKAARREG